MRKVLLLAVAIIGLASIAGAATLSFSQGAVFVQPSLAGLTLSVGSSTQIMWYADDLGYGVKNESVTIGDPEDMIDDPSFEQTINEIMIQKFLSKSVAIGLGIGTATDDGYTNPLVEINGAIQILSGKGEKINASLDFGIAARWINSENNVGYNMHQTASTLAVTIGL